MLKHFAMHSIRNVRRTFTGAGKYFNPWSHPMEPFLFRSAHFLAGLIEKYLQAVGDSQPTVFSSCTVHCTVHKREEKFYRHENHFNTHLNTLPKSHRTKLYLHSSWYRWCSDTNIHMLCVHNKYTPTPTHTLSGIYTNMRWKKIWPNQP